MVFSRIFAHSKEAGNLAKGSLIKLEQFSINIIEELMRLTRKGTNAHIFASILFWRTQKENQNFEDVNMRLAYEEAQGRDREAYGGVAMEESEDGGWEKDDANEAEFEDDDILLDKDAIAQSRYQDELRKAEEAKRNRGRPKKPQSAEKYYIADRVKEYREAHPNLSRKGANRALEKEFETLTIEERAPYEEQAVADKVRFAEEWEEWKEKQLAEGIDVNLPVEKKQGKKSKKNSKRSREQAAVDQFLQEKGVVLDYDSSSGEGSSEDVPMGLIAAGVDPKKLKKKKKVSPAAPAVPEFDDGGNFGPDEDESLREAFMAAKERDTAEKPRLLGLYFSSDVERTQLQLVRRCRALCLVNEREYNEMIQAIETSD
jgi:hypothetical protein